MEKLGTVCGRTFSQLVLLLTFGCGRNLFDNLFSIFIFSFFILFILCAIIISFTFTNKTLNGVNFTVMTCIIHIGNLLELVIVHTKFFYINFCCNIIKVCNSFLLNFFSTFLMESSFTISFTKDTTFRFFTKEA